jgi:hypothetical protein
MHEAPDPAIVAVDIETTKAAFGKALALLRQTGTSDLGIAIALVEMAAHHLIHDGATRDDFLFIVGKSWLAAERAHATENRSSTT